MPSKHVPWKPLPFIKAAVGTTKLSQVNVNIHVSTSGKRQYNEILITFGGLLFCRHILTCIILKDIARTAQ